MRTYKLTISYDGTRYQGWQRQPGAENTIQNVIENAICKLTGYEVKIQGSGRTDAGVHARGQVASLRLSGKVEEREFLRKLNAGLPEDIRIRSMELVPNTFHGRRSAKGKCYEYHVDLREKQQVFPEGIRVIIRKNWISRKWNRPRDICSEDMIFSQLYRPER